MSIGKLKNTIFTTLFVIFGYNIHIVNELLNTLSKDKWKRIGTNRRAGVLVPLFFVYSEDSIGVGDLNDLKKLIDWCVLSGNSILQLLPMNEVGSTSCPYDAISSFALESLYISLNNIPGQGSVPGKYPTESLKKKFPAGKIHVNYKVKEAKNKFLLDIYSKGSGTSKELEKFKTDNGYWLDDFALYKAIKRKHGGKPWYEWSDEYKGREEDALKKFERDNEEEVGFYKWMQWVAYAQFKEAKEYAKSRGILICGDLPILISKDSADVWAHPEFFRLEFAAGAPPDMYCAKGQRWGVPTYNWDNIRENGFKYLKEKLKFAENFYDMLRIDHVVGLFRIWTIPENERPENEGLNGFFEPREESVWEEHGRSILEAMNNSTGMLLCAEDLGVIPKGCPGVLKEYGMPGNEVQRWVKDWTGSHDFLEPDKYRLLSVSMLSTHDTTNWSAWWKYEAGTVDEALFIRKCADRGIDYEYVKDKLFDPPLSKYGRLKWLDSVDSVDLFVSILGKRPEELKDFIEVYENSYREKGKLWEHLGLKGSIKEECGKDIMAEAINITLKSNSIFCINLLTDYLYLADIFKGDPYQYRINRPGTVSKENWSLTMPITLEKLSTHKVSAKIKSMISRYRF